MELNRAIQMHPQTTATIPNCIFAAVPAIAPLVALHAIVATAAPMVLSEAPPIQASIPEKFKSCAKISYTFVR